MLMSRGEITKNSKNYCLDTRNKHIGILENGVFIFETSPTQKLLA